MIAVLLWSTIVLAAPLVHGLMRSMRARLQGRPGPSALQPYRDLFKLWGKEAVLPERASWLMVCAPGIVAGTAITLAGAVPLVYAGALDRTIDVVALVFVLALGRFALVLAAFDGRSAFAAMAASREVAFASLVDPALLLALLQVVFAEKLDRLGPLAAFTDGLEALRTAAAAFPPERVAGLTGLPAEVIRTLARDFAAAPSAVAYGRVGACTQEFGGLTAWLINALNVVTGNLDRVGGALFTSPAADLAFATALIGDRGHFGYWKTRVRGLPEFGGELPVSTLAEEIETEGPGQIRALITFAGNPVLSTPNGARLARALSRLDYMVSIDLYRNESTRYAHLILPTSFGFERDHYDLAFYALAVRNAARYVPAIAAPPPGVRDDFAVLLGLAAAVRKHGGGRAGLKQTLLLRAARALGPRRALDLLLRLGPRKLSLEKLLQHPHGLDLGPLEPRLPARLFTKGKRLQLAPAAFLADLPRLEAQLAAPAAGPDGLVLIGRRQLRSNNSWMHNSARLVKGPVACTLQMHPDDAAARSLVSGALVEVRSRAGAVRAPLAVTDEVSRGVVSLPHGWGHAPEGTALSVASAHAGVSANDLTDELRVDSLSGNAALTGVPVTVAAAR